MNIKFRYLALSVAVLLSLVFVSCEKDEFNTTAIEADVNQPTFSELVTYGKDGHFTATLTGKEMAYIMENEFGYEATKTPGDLSRLFAQTMFEQTPGTKKPGAGEEKMTTYGLTALIVTLKTNGDVLYNFDGIGGLNSSSPSTTVSATRVSSISSTFLMSCFSYVFTSDGNSYPLSYNDSSFDKLCPSNRPFYKGRAKMTFNGVGNYNGFAIVSCDRGLAEPDRELSEL